MLGPAKVNPIGHTFDAVLALAAVVMTHRPNARADIILDESERVVDDGEIVVTRSHVFFFAHRARAAFFAVSRRCSGDTPCQRALAPFLPPSRPEARNRSSAESGTPWRFR